MLEILPIIFIVSQDNHHIFIPDQEVICDFDYIAKHFFEWKDGQTILASPGFFEILKWKINERIFKELSTLILIKAALLSPNRLKIEQKLKLFKNCVTSFAPINREKLLNHKFPYNLENSFFDQCSIEYIRKPHIQEMMIIIRTFLNDEGFRQELIDYIFRLSQNSQYQNLRNKEDVIYVPADFNKLYPAKDNEIVFDFFDGSKAVIRLDPNGIWVENTQIELILLFWAFIDVIKTKEDRISVKEIFINLYLIDSPIIKNYMDEFKDYVQKKLVFKPFDFTPRYIYHLSVVASKIPSVVPFYESEKRVFMIQDQMKEIPFSLSGFMDYPPEETKSPINQELDGDKIDISCRNVIKIQKLLQSYSSLDEFPVWDFIPFWISACYEEIEIYDNILTKIDDHLVSFSNSYNIPIICEVIFIDTQFTLFEDLEPTMENSVPVSFEGKLVFELEPQTIKYFRINEEGSFWEHSECKYRFVSLSRRRKKLYQI